MDTMTDDSTAPGPAGPDRLQPPPGGGKAAPGRGPSPGARPSGGAEPSGGPAGTPPGGGPAAPPGAGPGGGTLPGGGPASPGNGSFTGGPGTPGGGAVPGADGEPSPDSGSTAVAGPAALLRSRRHKVIAGVCGGLGRYFDIDPVIFRVVLAVLALTGGVGLLVYGMAWLFIPLRGQSRNEAQRLLSGRVEGSGMAAVLTSLAGCAVFLSTLGSDGGQPFPLFVIGAVLGAIYWSQRRRGSAAPAWATRGGTTQVADAPPAAQPPPSPGAPSWWKGASTDGAPGAPPSYLWGPDDGTGGPERGAKKTAVRPGPREPRSFLGLTTFGLAVVAGAVGVAASWSSPLGTSLEIGFACALAVLGAGLTVGSVLGRARGGTVFLALVTSALLVGAASLPKTVAHEWQKRTWRPVSAAEARPSYGLGTGYGLLDLTALDPGGRTVRVRAEVGAGLLRVRVPENVRVDVVARSGVGVVQVPGGGRNDIDVSVDASRDTVLEAAGPKKGRLKGVVELDLDVGVGQVEVIREAP